MSGSKRQQNGREPVSQIGFQGIPTRAGRVMMRVFGACCVIPGLATMGIAFLGLSEAEDRLPLALFGLSFLLVGLYLLAPAFPGLVNRVLRSENRLVKWLAPAMPAMTLGTLVITMSLFPTLAALNIIPSDDSSWHAPRWIGLLIGGLFTCFGLHVFCQPFKTILGVDARRFLTGLLPLLLVTVFAIISSWIAFGPGERGFGVGVGNGAVSYYGGGLGEWLGRGFFGLSAMFLVVITLVGWWRFLRNDW